MAIRDSGTAASWSNDRWPFPGDLTIKINESFLGGAAGGSQRMSPALWVRHLQIIGCNGRNIIGCRRPWF